MSTKKNSKSTKKNNGVLFTTACVVLGLLVILIIFLVKKDQIFTNLKETAFFDRVFGTTPEFVEKHEPASKKENDQIPLKNDEVTIVIDSKEPETKPEEVIPLNTLKETPQTVKTPVTENKKTEEKKDSVKSENTVVPTTEVQLCFVQFDGDGLVVRKVVKRTVNKNDSPLTNSLNLLLKGPDTTKSTEKNCITLIPKGTKLLSAKVSDGTAYLNFNEDIEFNEMGIEGSVHSLEQIVYTATAFPTVNSVQILIEGDKKPFLGLEGGLRIDVPLTRNSF